MTDQLISEPTARDTDGPIDKWTDGPMDRQMDGERERESNGEERDQEWQHDRNDITDDNDINIATAENMMLQFSELTFVNFGAIFRFVSIFRVVIFIIGLQRVVKLVRIRIVVDDVIVCGVGSQSKLRTRIE